MVNPCACNPLPKSGAGDGLIELYTEGDELFEAMLAAIGRAKKKVWMETYIANGNEER